MRSTQKKYILPQFEPNQIFMHFIRQKNRYWPVKLLQVFEYHPITKQPLKARFQVFRNSKPPKKFTKTKIELNLKPDSPLQLIPFESVYNNNSGIQHAIEARNGTQKDSEEFRIVMHEATKVFENQLNTHEMYIKLKKMDLKYYNIKNQSPSSQSQFKSKKTLISNTKKLNNNFEFKQVPKMAEYNLNLKNQDKNGLKKDSKKTFQSQQKQSQIQSFKQRQYKRKTKNKLKKQYFQKQAKKIPLKLIKKGTKAIISYTSDDQNLSQSPKHQKYSNMKRCYKIMLNNDASIKSLESPKKKRRISKSNAAITNLEKDQASINPKLSKLQSSQSQVAKKTSRYNQKKIKQKSQLIYQQYYSLLQNPSNSASKLSKSHKSRNDKEKNKKLQGKKQKRKRATDSNMKHKFLISNMNHNQKINFQPNQDLITVKSEAIRNNPQFSTKMADKNSNKINRLPSHKKMLPKFNVKIQMDNSYSEKSFVSSRTRSKALSNKKMNSQLTDKKSKPYPQPLFQKDTSIQKTRNTKKQQEQTCHLNQQNKHTHSKTKKLPFLKPSLKIHRQSQIYTSINGQRLNVEEIFFIFKNIFEKQIIKDDLSQKLKRCQKIKSQILKKGQKINSCIYAGIMNEEKTELIENQLLQKRKYYLNCRIQNHQNGQRKQEESEQYIFAIKNEEQAVDDNQSPFKLVKKSKILQNNIQNPEIKIEKIVKEKDLILRQINFLSKKTVTEAKVKNEEISISFQGQIKTEIINPNKSSRNHALSKRLSIKYQMNLIDSLDDLMNLIKKEVPQKDNSNTFKIHDRNQVKAQSNQMDFQSFVTKNQLKPLEDKRTIFLVVERSLPINSKLVKISEVPKKKLIKKRKNRKPKNSSKVYSQCDFQQTQADQDLNNYVEEIVFTWPIQKLIFHELLTNLQNLYFSIARNEHFIVDLIKYNGSQNQFFTVLFPIINSISISSIQIKQRQQILPKKYPSHADLQKNIKKSSKDSRNIIKNVNDSLNLQPISQINSKPKGCGHKFCNKIVISDQKILQNLFGIVSIQETFFQFNDKDYQIYRDFIVKQAQLILNEFQINFRDKKFQENTLTLDQNTFKQNCFNILTKFIEQNKLLQIQSCFYAKILILVVKVFNIFSYETVSIQYLKKQGKKIGIEKQYQKHDIVNHEQKKSTKSSFQNSKRLKEMKLNKKDFKIQLDKGVKHPDQKRFALITTLPFSIQMDEDNFERGSEMTQTNSLNSSGVTEFERNTSDFTSFVANILPQIGFEKYKSNLTKNQRPIFSSYNDLVNNSQVSTFRKYSQKIDEKQGEIYFNEFQKGQNSACMSSISFMFNNSKTSKVKNEKKISLYIANQNQTKSNKNQLNNHQQNKENKLYIREQEEMSKIMKKIEAHNIERLKEEFEKENSTCIKF